MKRIEEMKRIEGSPSTHSPNKDNRPIGSKISDFLN
jgi:hypothetical protein